MKISFKAMLEEQYPALGTCLQFSSCEMLEYLQLAGLDFVYLDLEHGSITLAELPALIRACEACGIVPGVRLPLNDYLIMKVIEMGVSSIKVSRIDTATDACKVVSLCRYPPEGTLGGCPHTRNNSYGTNTLDCFKDANQRLFLSVIVESASGLEHLEEIIKVDGVDCIAIGKGDLARCMGLHVKDPALIEIQLRCAAMCQIHGKCCSVHADTSGEILRYSGEPAINHFIMSYPDRYIIRSYARAVGDMKNAVQDNNLVLKRR